MYASYDQNIFCDLLLTSFSVSPPVWMDGFCFAMAVHVLVFWTV